MHKDVCVLGIGLVCIQEKKKHKKRPMHVSKI